MRLSTSFVLDEFECHDGTPVPDTLIPTLRQLCEGVLQPLRNRWGPLTIVSGYRTPEYNGRIHGAATSTHMTCEAADVRPSRHGDIVQFHEDILRMHKSGLLPALGGLGVYKNWVHVDIRHAADGHLRRWNGRGVGSENA